MKNNLKQNQIAQTPPKFVAKMANIVLVLGALLSFLIVMFAFYRMYNPIVDSLMGNKAMEKFYFNCSIFGGVLVVLFGLGLRLNSELKVNISIMLITIGVSFYGLETYLEFSRKPLQTRKMKAEKLGISYDTRTTMELLQEFKESGVVVYPAIKPQGFIPSDGLKNKTIFPIGGISNSKAVLLNEAGFYPIIETDEHGFNNPKGYYDKNKATILLTGDSFTEGYSVHQGETLRANLTKLGLNTISIGKGGNGPLIEFAAIKEYGKPLKPKVVLWRYFMNDIPDLKSEIGSPFLNQYLSEEDFSQSLISRQDEIDSILKIYVQGEWDKGWEKEKELKRKQEIDKIANNSVLRILKFVNLRAKVNLTPQPQPLYDKELLVFKKILKNSKQIVSGWGGKFYFVYLPWIDRYLNKENEKFQETVLQSATELDIPIIDIHKEVFSIHPDPISLFPLRTHGHYTGEGYRLVAEAVAKRLDADGLLVSSK